MTLFARLGSLAILCLLVAACSTSGDGRPSSSSESATTSADTSPVVVVLDGSESMLTADAPGPRIDAARAAVTDFATGLPDGTPFGLVAYGNMLDAKTTRQAAGCQDVTTIMDLARIDKGAAAGAIAGVEAQGWTPLSKALTQGVELLADSGGSVVLVSDGEANCPPDPCDTAQQLRARYPDVTISTIGFRATNTQLECIAREGGGVYITADNSQQLAARITAARDADSASAKLTDTGLAGVNLGSRANEIRATTPGFPELSTGTADGDRVVVRWRDCEWVFADGVLVEIRPLGPSVTTVDGVTVGTPMSRVVELFGEAVSDDKATSTAYFAAEEPRGIALRIAYDGDVVSGTVRTLTLCTCLPKPTSQDEADNCGPTADFPKLRVVARGVDCQTALRLVERYVDDPRTQRGDRGAQIDAWGCNILGAAETEAGEPVIRCKRPDGAQVTVEEPRSASDENATPTKQDVCNAWQQVSDLYRTRNLINSRGPAGDLEAVAALGDLATRYPDEAVQYEGTYLAKLAGDGSVTISAFTSQQNLKALCRA
ncbi:vWA domain-containing protein [Gordonia terrae]|uniref:vWA domain-containing protein n=1 Tax=Gordonia terrae TaxID=2055 RepID=UPI001181394A|nr:VWA domain-containing protein [Gordonia terrae]